MLVKAKVIAANYIPGALEFISKNKHKRQFICTGTPQTEIEEIVKKKKYNLYLNVYMDPQCQNP